MGINWKVMTLLSTLAALVIIVHSAEEDFEDYRDLRPRRMETFTPGYEQTWRMLETESIRATQSTQPNWDVTHQEEPLKRRRPVRKRKRRPLISSEDDLIPQERHIYNEEYLPYQNEQFTPEPSIIRRRRKQFDSRQPERLNSWNDETIDANRPMVRKRGHKRKRPSVETPWPELSEFNEHNVNDNTEENDETYEKSIESIKKEDSLNYDTREVYLPNDDTVIKTDAAKRNTNKYVVKETSNIGEYILDAVADTDNSNYKKDIVNDQSLSEFSLENERPSKDIINIQEKISEKSVSTDNDVHKSKSNVTVDPQTLKEILKKSNGRSLSEILQQHNLSLVDLLHGKEKAISILKMIETKQNDSEILKSQSNVYSVLRNENEDASRGNKRLQNRNFNPTPKESSQNLVIVQNIATVPSITSTIKPTNRFQYKQTIQPTTEYITSRPFQFTVAEKNRKVAENPKTHSHLQVKIEESPPTTKPPIRHRYPVGVRRKIRMRPMNNTSYKSQLSRDLIALTSRRYQLSRNSSRSREWRDMVPTMIKVNRKEHKINSEKPVLVEVIPTTSIPEETTIQQSYEQASIVSDITEVELSTTNTETTIDPSTETIYTVDMSETEAIPTSTTTSSTTTATTSSTTTSTSTTTITSITSTTTVKPTEKITSKSGIKSSDLRRQAFNYRLKRKRLKQKPTTTESTQDYAMKDIFGMANLVSASEFIAKIQPRTTINDEEQDFTTLEDFMTTEASTKTQTKSKLTKVPIRYSTTYANIPIEDMEETAKIEIEEILNDTRTSAKLSKILMERNMTINELVEHRERGSSHIHLADIFHNASREPNPPEPFLSKSLIEPISKETYPLRALLEANLHDPTAKATTIDPNSTLSHNLNIPVVMDFGNNVNENGENMGIISLFNNFTKDLKLDGDTKETKEQPQIPSSVAPEDSVNHYNYGVSRESRILNNDKDLITWKEIIAIMHRGRTNNTGEVVELTTREILPSHAKKIVLDDDMNDDDGLIVLNDLQPVKNFDNLPPSTSDEKLEVHMREKTELPQIHGVLNKTSNSAKSVTVATASIIGLAMVLFLLTYVAFRWKQQRSLFRDKQNLRTCKIPSPVFESRKGHKHNSSTRSKSPMISSSNIYTIDTIDNRNGNDSPEYMWDTIRKPFQ